MDQNALWRIGYGLYVLTAREGERDNGCIVNTVMQITSSAPYRLVCAVNKKNYTHELIRRSGVFDLSILTEKAPLALYERFGFRSGRDVNKFDGLRGVKRSENGLLYLTEGANAYLSLRVTGESDFDTHTLFSAELTEAELLSTDPSVTYAYYQEKIKPKPAPKAKGWRCEICGYVYEGEELPPDFICPLCKHGVGDFVKIEE
ncbi:MAG: flavin reductase [Bacteroides sp.]|nr:flavin reductase [Eubacterium sp.]MCM1418985.1 flavin reductase [Roseburia sp.]MCM1463121.1 flavin reductase [Bacteroides sp.]